MAFIFIIVISAVVLAWAVKAFRNKKISGTSYTPYDDMIAGTRNSHPPLESKEDRKHSDRYEEINLPNDSD